MEIFLNNSRHMTDLLVKFQNKEIDKNKFNTNIFLDIALNYYYFTKESKKTIKLKEYQNKIFQSFFKKETAQETQEKILKHQAKIKKEPPEKVDAVIKKQRKDLLDNLLSNKDISIYAEHTYNSYIPPKNYSLSLNFHLSGYKEFKKYLSVSGAEISYKNPSILNKDKDNDNIINAYSEPPYIIDENNDILILSKNKQNNDNNNINNINDYDLIKESKKENSEEIKKLINNEEDDMLFYSEKIKDDEMLKTANWLNDISSEEINMNFVNLTEVRKNNKTLNNDNYFEFDANYSISEFNPSSIFDDIPLGGDRYKKFSQYLSDKCYKNYMKKMNYNYLDLMLLNYYNLKLEFKKYNFLGKETIALNYIKKKILSSGICNSKLYEHIIRAITSKKGNFDLENFLECFTPIFEASEKYQTLKYRFLLFLSKAQNSKIYSMDNYRTFCNLIKGKLIYEEDTYKRLSKNMIENFKEKYPKEFTDNFKYFQIATIVEFLVEKEYKEQ